VGKIFKVGHYFKTIANMSNTRVKSLSQLRAYKKENKLVGHKGFIASMFL